MVMVELNPQQATIIEEQHRLRTVLQQQSGEKAKVPVIGVIQAGNSRQLVRFGRQFWVQDSLTAFQALNDAGFRALVKPLTSI